MGGRASPRADARVGSHASRKLSARRMVHGGSCSCATFPIPLPLLIFPPESSYRERERPGEGQAGLWSSPHLASPSHRARDRCSSQGRERESGVTRGHKCWAGRKQSLSQPSTCVRPGSRGCSPSRRELVAQLLQPRDPVRLVLRQPVVLAQQLVCGLEVRLRLFGLAEREIALADLF